MSVTVNRSSLDRTRAISNALLFALTAVGVVAGCGSGGDAPAAQPVGVAPPPAPPAAPPAPTPPAPPAPPPVSSGPPKLATYAQDLNAPWGMAFLPDNRIIVTEKVGSVRVVSADGKTVSAALIGAPVVTSAGQGGLLDVAIDPDFAMTQRVFFTFSEPDPAGGSRNATAVYRAKLQGNTLVEGSVIFRMNEYMNSGGHFGSRIAFASDKSMFVTFGDRQSSIERDKAQDPFKHHGKVVRINRDGTTHSSIPRTSPASFVEAMWSYGHRNPQGAAIHPTTGELWVGEHGPQGGDEVNIVRLGKNYGWPVISYGCEYGTTPQDSCVWAGGTSKLGMEQPLTYWRPLSIAPSNIAFYTGDKFPEWKGSLFIGAMSGNAGGQRLWRLTINATNDGVTSREELFASAKERIRDVDQGPDGWIYLLTDSGKIIRVER
jgi:aldose sugar dehydrogenase